MKKKSCLDCRWSKANNGLDLHCRDFKRKVGRLDIVGPCKTEGFRFFEPILKPGDRVMIVPQVADLEKGTRGAADVGWNVSMRRCGGRIYKVRTPEWKRGSHAAKYVMVEKSRYNWPVYALKYVTEEVPQNASPFAIIKELTQKVLNAYDWYIIGGALLPHKSPDIDVVVVVPENEDLESGIERIRSHAPLWRINSPLNVSHDYNSFGKEPPTTFQVGDKVRIRDQFHKIRCDSIGGLCHNADMLDSAGKEFIVRRAYYHNDIHERYRLRHNAWAWAQAWLELVEAVPKAESAAVATGYKVDAVISFEKDTQKYDLLVIKNNKFDIMQLFKEFPLSIQKIARRLIPDELFMDPQQEHRPILVAPNAQRKFVEKYQRYYPTDAFEAAA